MNNHIAMDRIPTFTTAGQRLEWWINRRNRTQTDVAKGAGMAQSALSEIVAGRSKRPSAENLLRLAKELHLRPEYVVFGEGPPEALHFSQLSGLEAQLVMMFRALPDDAKRDALLIDVNDYYNRHVSKGAPTKADPFGHGAPPPAVTPPAPAAPKVKAKQGAKKVTT